MQKMKKPDGRELDVDEKSVDYALTLGWVLVKEKATRNVRNSKQPSK